MLCAVRVFTCTTVPDPDRTPDTVQKQVSQALGIRDRLQIDMHNSMAGNQGCVSSGVRAFIKMLPQVAHAVRAHTSAAVALTTASAQTSARIHRGEILERQRDVSRTGRAIK